MSRIKYFGGASVLSKKLYALPCNSFHELFEHAFKFPIMVDSITRRAYHKLPTKQERNKYKDVAYVSPGAYQRQSALRAEANITEVNLLCFDVDDSSEAKQFVDFPELLKLNLEPFNFIAYHSASSTNKKPRIRLIIDTDGIDKKLYTKAVSYIASKLQIKLNRESRTSALPMYRPTAFHGETYNPVFLYSKDGRAFVEADIGDAQAELADSRKERVQQDYELDELDYLKSRVDAFSVDVAKGCLGKVNPDIPRDEWLQMAFGLNHQFGEDGWELFHDWSARGKLYDGEEHTRSIWDSTHQSSSSRTPITIRSVMKIGKREGWNPEVVIGAEVDKIERAIAALDGTRSEMVSKAMRLISTIPLLNPVDEDALLTALNKTTMKHFKYKSPIAALKKLLVKTRSEGSFDAKQTEKLFQWANDFCYVSKTDEFVVAMTGQKFTAETLDRTFGNKFIAKQGKSDEGKLIDLAPEILPQRYLLFNCDITRVYDFTYDPSNSSRILSDGEEDNEGKPIQYLNTYKADYPPLDKKEAERCGEIFLEHIDHLVIEKEYQRILIDWLAFNVQHPGVKIRWAPLIQGVQGCGKTFLFEMLSAVLGPSNANSVEASAISQPWNEWAANAQVVALEEVRMVGHTRYEVLNKLKPLIANTKVSVSQRFRDQRNEQNITNYILFTNFHDAIPIDDSDRRHFVLKSRLQTEKQVLDLEKSYEGYFDRLFKMIEEHPGGMRSWLLDCKISKKFNANGRAPKTRYHKELVENTSDDVKTALREYLEGQDIRVQDDLLSSNILVLMFETDAIDVNPRRIGLILTNDGFEKRVKVQLDGTRHTIWAKAGGSFCLTECPDPEEVKEEFVKRDTDNKLLG